MPCESSGRFLCATRNNFLLSVNSNLNSCLQLFLRYHA